MGETDPHQLAASHTHTHLMHVFKMSQQLPPHERSNQSRESNDISFARQHNQRWSGSSPSPTLWFMCNSQESSTVMLVTLSVRQKQEHPSVWVRAAWIQNQNYTAASYPCPSFSAKLAQHPENSLHPHWIQGQRPFLGVKPGLTPLDHCLDSPGPAWDPSYSFLQPITSPS